ncbi:MAG: porin [Pseudomonadota bacterium]|nr:porin [Pseudomonadota bacterium]
MSRTPLPVALLAAALNSPAPAIALADEPASPPSWQSITLYGVVDIGVAYQSHGANASDYFAQGVGFGVSKNSGSAVTGLAPNGLSQTRLGVKGTHAFSEDLSGLFTLETRFSPLSGEIANGPHSLLQNNGVALAAQSANGDSSQAGQLFSAAAWAGVSSKRFGTLTLGRQNGLLYDNVLAYDPLAGSYAFSLIGFSSSAAGGGYSEYNRLNNSARYVSGLGPVRFGAQYQASGQEVGGQGYQFNIGASHAGLSADLTYTNKRDAISLGSWSPTTAQLTVLQRQGLTLANSLAADVADTRSVSLMARSEWDDWTVFGGYEAIVYSTPDSTLPYVAVGASTIGGYAIGSLNTTSFAKAKVLGVSWAGAKYALTQEIALMGAVYHYRQNSYATDRSADCSSSISAACSGIENAFSLVADYRYDDNIDFYGGVLHSRVEDGLSAGYLNTSVLSVMSGVRIAFRASHQSRRKS